MEMCRVLSSSVFFFFFFLFSLSGLSSSEFLGSVRGDGCAVGDRAMVSWDAMVTLVLLGGKSLFIDFR
jgi:hypothetical protein